MTAAADDFGTPLDVRELCLRVRFSLDEPVPMPEAESERRSVEIKRIRAMSRIAMLKVSADLMPRLHEVVALASGRLLVDPIPEVFIEPSLHLNAGAYVDGGRSFVTLNSGLVNHLSPGEICSVIGHELAHIALDHRFTGAETVGQEILSLERKRAAEVSCDRVALLACRDVATVLQASLKIATGLRDDHFEFDVERLVANVERPPDDVDPDWQSESTHPAFPFRAWAIERFSRTDRYRSLVGLGGGLPFDEIERQIEERFLAIDGGIAFQTGAKLLHALLTWAGVLMVVHDERVSDEERELLVRLVGIVWADDAVAYQRRHGTAAVERRLGDALKAVPHFSTRSISRIESALREFAGRTNLDGKADEILERIRTAAKPG